MTLPAITPDSPYIYLAVLGVFHIFGAGQIMNAIRGAGYSARAKSGISLIRALFSMGVQGVSGVVILLLPLVFGYLLLEPVFFLIEIGILIFSIVLFAVLMPLSSRVINWETVGTLAIASLFFFIGLGLTGSSIRNGGTPGEFLRNLSLMGVGGLILYFTIRRIAGLEEE